MHFIVAVLLGLTTAQGESIEDFGRVLNKRMLLLVSVPDGPAR